MTARLISLFNSATKPAEHKKADLLKLLIGYYQTMDSKDIKDPKAMLVKSISVGKLFPLLYDSNPQVQHYAVQLLKCFASNPTSCAAIPFNVLYPISQLLKPTLYTEYFGIEDWQEDLTHIAFAVLNTFKMKETLAIDPRLIPFLVNMITSVKKTSLIVEATNLLSRLALTGHHTSILAANVVAVIIALLYQKDREIPITALETLNKLTKIPVYVEKMMESENRTALFVYFNAVTKLQKDGSYTEQAEETAKLLNTFPSIDYPEDIKTKIAVILSPVRGSFTADDTFEPSR